MIQDRQSVMGHHESMNAAYSTSLGSMYETTLESFLASNAAQALAGQVQLIFTSPPFPLNRKKRYGNESGTAFIDWLSGLARPLAGLLCGDGSIVIEMGNAWEPNRPVMSTLTLRALIEFIDAGELKLCQQFVCYNPARLPSPAEWVNVRRIRVKDSFTHIWWLSANDFPKADNRKVLTEYSVSMKRLLRTGKYNAGKRPSGHDVGLTSFLHDNSGAIPPNVLVAETTQPGSLLTFSNTTAGGAYRDYCRRLGIEVHPAPMPDGLAAFFIKLLTDEGDLVLDPFAGSNTTGAAAEELSRRWVAIEPVSAYVLGSRGRFEALNEAPRPPQV